MEFGLVEKLKEVLPDLIYETPSGGTFDFEPYVIAALLFFGLSLLFKLIQVVVVAYLKKLSIKTVTDMDDVAIGAVAGIRPFVYMITAFYISVQTLEMVNWLDQSIKLVFLVAVVWQLVNMAVIFVDYFARRALQKRNEDGEIDASSATAAHMVGLLARIVLWILGLLLILSNMGVEITALVASFGVMGVAVAFAMQGILEDLFNSFSIQFDKPFQVGDYIVIGTDSGTVEKIGIKTTRIRTLQGEELVVSNKELTTVRVQNFKMMEERRILTKFGVTYDTPQEKLKAIPGMIERIFEAEEGGRLDRVHFTEFGDSALMFDVVYYVESSEYVDFLDIQQRINFDIMDKFAEVGIEFAYPTQTLYIKKEQGG